MAAHADSIPLGPLMIRAAVGGAGVGLAAVACWLVIAWTLPADDEPAGRLAFAGWILLVLVIATCAGILWAARSTPCKGSGVGAILGYAVLADVVGVISLCVGLIGGYLGWRQGLQYYALAAAWLAPWMALAWALRRRGIGAAIGAPLAASMVCMSSPITLMPLVRAAAHWGDPGGVSPWQGRMAEMVGVICPFLPALDALRPSLIVHWGQLPGMYRLSGLGQDVPLALPSWWVNASVYLATGVLIAVAGVLLKRRQATTVIGGSQRG